MNTTGFNFENGYNATNSNNNNWKPTQPKRFTANITGKPVEGDPTRKAIDKNRRVNLG